MQYKPEIIAPAGSHEGLTAAARCGADAVYLGGKILNARRGASNFDENTLPEAVSYCHARNIKVYLTLNTLVFDDELPLLLKTVETACKSGIDAIITQDLAAAAMIRATAPSMPLHASTQMSIHNLRGAQKLLELGFSRVVLAREMSYKEIETVVKNTDIETEVFVHGALCMSVSGQCLLSSMLGGRSGNRGLCAQPCRLPFQSEDNSHALSLRDMSHILHIHALSALGVSSLKIEGRLKRPEYVAAAVTACRRALNGETPDMSILEAVFSRGGFTDGYFTGKRGRSMFGVRGKENVTAAAAVLKPLAALYKDERQSVPLNMKLTMRSDSPAVLTVSDDDGNTANVNGAIPEAAIKSALTKERAAMLLSKTGGTPYTVKQIDAEIDEGLILPAAALNALRRDVVDCIHELRSAPRSVPFSAEAALSIIASQPTKTNKNQLFRVRLGNANQVYQKLLNEADVAILPLNEWANFDIKLLRPFTEKLIIEIPHILFDSETSKATETLREVRAFGIKAAVAGNLGGIKLAGELGFSIHGDHSLNIVNSAAFSEYSRLGLRSLTLSFETSALRISRLNTSIPFGILAYGKLPLMTFRNCPSNCTSCKKSPSTLTDRLGKSFHLSCAYGAATLYNSVPLYLADKLGSFKSADFFTLYFTNETPAECQNILSSYKNRQTIEGPKTNGLYFRQVL